MACFYPVLLLLLVPFSAFAYPEFIGYKYSSCLTCHYNSQGNGPINDYGRALWAAEIAGRLWATETESEKLAESSGFLGKVSLPWWLRPGLKARQLWFETNPGSSKSQWNRILMQAEANLALFFDPDQKYALVASYGYTPKPEYLQGPAAAEFKEWISREHYFRLQAGESLWLYFGKMDVAYGIRHVNHTAYNRSLIGLGQKDQTHGLMAHFIRSNWELTLHGFVGDLEEKKNLRQEGASVLYEYEVKEAWRIGGSALSSKSETEKRSRLGLHSRQGFGHGTALLFELGLMENKAPNSERELGYYLFSEAMQRIVRGYHFFVSGQMYKSELKAERSENLKLGGGLLFFPMTRTEFRIEAENTRQLTSSTEVPDDIWAILAQIHLSL